MTGECKRMLFDMKRITVILKWRNDCLDFSILKSVVDAFVTAKQSEILANSVVLFSNFKWNRFFQKRKTNLGVHRDYAIKHKDRRFSKSISQLHIHYTHH